MTDNTTTPTADRWIYERPSARGDLIDRIEDLESDLENFRVDSEARINLLLEAAEALCAEPGEGPQSENESEAPATEETPNA